MSAMLTLFWASVSPAATYNWAPPSLGAGSWNWNNASGQNNWGAGFPNAIGDTAGVTANLTGDQTLNLNQVITVGSLTLGDTDGSHAYTIAPNGGSLTFQTAAGNAALTQTATSKGDTVSAALTLTSPLDVTNNGAGILTLSGNLNGSSALTKLGTGQVTLAASNGHAVPLVVNNGVLKLNHANALGTATATTTVNPGGTLDLNLIAWNILEPITVSGTGYNGQGAIINNNGSGAPSLDGPITFAGDTTFGGTVGFKISSALNGGASLTKVGAGTLTLSGTSNNTGTLTVTGGTVSINADRALGAVPGATTPGLVVLSNGALQATASFTLDAKRGIALGGNGAVLGINAVATYGQIDMASPNVLTYNGVLADAPGQTGVLDKTNTGTLVLGGASTYTGRTYVWAGTIQLGASNALPATTVLAMGGSANGTFDLNSFSQTIGGMYRSSRVETITNTAAATTSTLTVNTTTSTISTMNGQVFNGWYFDGNLNDGTGALALIKTGPYTLGLGATNSYSGGTAINGGTLAVFADANLGTGSSRFNGGTLQVISPAAAAPFTTTKAITLNAGGGTVDVLNTNATASSLNGNVGGVGGLTKSGPYPLTLGGSNSYGGGTTVTAGTLSLTGSNSGTGAVLVKAGTLAVTGAAGALSGPTSLTAIGAGVLQAGDSVVANNTAARLNSGAALALGTTERGGGTLSVGLASGGGGFTQSLASLTLNPGAATVTSVGTGTAGNPVVLQFTGALTRNPGSTANFVPATGYSIRLSTPPTLDAGGLIGGWATAAGSDFATLDGSNNVVATGYTTQNAVGSWAANQNITNSAALAGSVGSDPLINSLRFGAGTPTVSFAAAGNTLTIQSGGIIGNAAGAQTIGASAGSGNLTAANGNQLTVITANNQALTINSNIVDPTGGAIGLLKSGTGTGVLNLRGTNTYSGGTTIAAGTLNVTADSQLGMTTASPNLVLAGGTLQYGAAFTLNAARTIQPRGGAIDTNGQTVSLAAPFVGSGVFSKTGTGTLTLTADNSGYSGEVHAAGGTLKVGGASALGTNANLYIDVGGTVDLNGFSTAKTINFTNTAYTSAYLYNQNAASPVTVSGTIWTPPGTVAVGPAYYYIGGAGNLTLTGPILQTCAISPTSGGTWYKDGTGTVTIQGTANNTFGGGYYNGPNLGFQISDGTVRLNNTPTTDALGYIGIQVGDGTGAVNSAVLRLLGPNQINDQASLTLKPDGLFDMNGFNETIGGINLNSVTLDTGAATLTMTAQYHLNDGGTTGNVINGHLYLNGSGSSYSLTGDTTINADIAGPATVGANYAMRRLVLTNAANSFSGGITWNGGNLVARAGGNVFGTTASAISLALGANNDNNSTLTIDGPYSLRYSFTAGSAPNATRFAIRSLAASNVGTGNKAQITGTVDLTNAPIFAAPAASTDTLELAGIVSSGANSNGIVKTGAGALLLSAANTYKGPTAIRQGTVLLGASAPVSAAGALGNAAGAISLGDAVSVVTGARLATTAALPTTNVAWATGQYTGTGLPASLDGITLANGDVILVKDETGATQLRNGLYTRTSATQWDRTADTMVYGARSAVSAGTANGGQRFFVATLIPVTLNTTGLAFAQDAANPDVALLTNGPWTVSRDVNVTANSSSGASTLGGNTDDSSLFSGNVTLYRNLQLTSVTTGMRKTTFSGSITDGAGSFAVTKTGAGTVELTGVSNYDGGTFVTQGRLLVNSPGVITGPVSVSGGAILGGTGTVGDVTSLPGSTLSPGASAGTLTAGNLTLADDTVLDVELGDALSVGASDHVNAGALNLDGVLNVTGLTGFGIPVGAGFARYSLISYSNLGADNGLVLGTNPGGPFNYVLGYTAAVGAGAGDVYLIIPEPGAAVLLLAALFGFACRRRLYSSR